MSVSTIAAALVALSTIGYLNLDFFSEKKPPTLF